MTLIRYSFFLLAFLWMAYGHANTTILEESEDRVVVRSVGEYQMGEGDSKVDARKVALAQAKRLATEKAGTYLESRLKVDGGQVSSRDVTAVAAGYLQSVVLEEDVSLEANDRMVYRITIRAEVDKTALREKVKDLREDPKKDARIKKLQKRNGQLEKRLRDLTERIQEVKDARAEALFQQREKVLTQISENRAQVKKTLEGKTMLDLAQQGERRWKRIKNKLKTHFWPKLKEQAHFELGKLSADRNGDGSSNVSIRVTAGVNSGEALAWLRKHMTLASHVDAGHERESVLTGFSKFDNEGADKKRPYSKKLFNEIVGSTFGVEVHLGDLAKRVDLLAGDCGFMGDDNCLVGRMTREVTFSNVPNTKLQELSEVKARIIAKDRHGDPIHLP